MTNAYVINTLDSCTLVVPTDNIAPQLFLEALAGYQVSKGDVVLMIFYPAEDAKPMFYIKMAHVRIGNGGIELPSDVYDTFARFINDNLILRQ